ncbi:glycosyltransferase family 2 protein [Bradyrhizobium acaciae]|uniref:glycosyltransferase family 2 protein n=1 Tax=Bradyrhizobium acaciae TaxID=2683706 RepID=UPI001E40A17D|nr:glycosyltransferase family 2 protein [Bradyrhizobium acaciae]MCC8979645.1 glycosyltransferase family 2 protein [Bradyrhizobium acaciae]
MTADARRIAFTSRTLHHVDLERAAVGALEARNFRRAFALADRRCRILPHPGARAHLLRAEALFHLDLRDAALACVARAIELEPDDLVAARRMMAWGDGPQQIEAARSVARRDDDPDSVRSALLLLEQSGQDSCARVDFLDEEVKGWVTWRGADDPHLSLAQANQSSTIQLPADPRHGFALDGRRAASFRLIRPASATSQRLEITQADRVIASIQLPANRAPDRRSTPQRPARARNGETPPLTVIIPVYRDLAATRACIESALTAVACTPGSTILVVDDATPEPDIKRLLGGLAAELRIRLLTNEHNLGFVGAVNRALGATGAGDVVLLNSDTIVPKYALQRLRSAVQSTPRVGTATPLSNNGEYTSFPVPNRSNPLPSPSEIELLDELAGRANSGIAIDIPNGIGFCLYITRECLDAVRELSDDFYRGYLEDVDFCLRAAEAGFRNVCIPSVFVGHEGSRSFLGEKRSLVLRNLRVLEHRYRRYATECAAFLLADPLRDCRAALELKLLSNEPRGDGPHVIVCGSSVGREIAIRRCRQLAKDDQRGLVVHVRSEGQRQPAAIFDPDGGVPQSIALDVATDEGRETLLTLLTDLKVRLLEIAEPNRLPAAGLALLTQRFAYDLLITDTALATRAAIGSGSDPDWTDLIAGARRMAVIGDDGAAFSGAVLGLQAVRLSDTPAPPTQHHAVDGPARLGLLALHAGAAEFRFIRALSDHMAAADEDAEITVLGTTLDDLKLMQRTNVVVAGDVTVDEIATLIEGHGITKLVLDIGQPAFGHPLVDALLATGLPAAATEWIATPSRSRTADLKLQPGSDADATIAAVLDWVVEDVLLHPDRRNGRHRRQVGARLP